jgi:3-methyladenine DNA glycosylase/8-oxoguanine DNA glycosylase
LFPTPEVIAEGDLSDLGVPASRVRALQALAGAIAEGSIGLDPAADPKETRARLLALPGIGPWTVEYILMRALRDPDAFPAGDIVLRRVCSDRPQALSEKQLMKCAESWRPWRAYAVLHLWRASSRAAQGSNRTHARVPRAVEESATASVGRGASGRAQPRVSRRVSKSGDVGSRVSPQVEQKES